MGDALQRFTGLEGAKILIKKEGKEGGGRGEKEKGGENE